MPYTPDQYTRVFACSMLPGFAHNADAHAVCPQAVHPSLHGTPLPNIGDHSILQKVSIQIAVQQNAPQHEIVSSHRCVDPSAMC